MRTSRLVTVLLSVIMALLGSVVMVPAAHASSAGTMVGSINASRRTAGLPPYTVRSDLAAVALAQAQRMAASNTLYHNPNLATDVKNYSWVGENVGYGPDLATLHQAFMNSAPHRANILSTKFTEVGVGLVEKNGVIWVAEVFRRPLSVARTTTTRTPTVSKPAARSTPAPSVRPAAVKQSKPSPAPTLVKKVAPVKKPVTVPTDTRPVRLCSATPTVVTTIRSLLREERSVWQVQQLQRLVNGFQCGRSLPQSGVLDPDTLQAFHQVG